MAESCAWIFGEVERGTPVRRCPMPQDGDGPYCVFHRRRSRRKLTRADLRQVDGAEDAAA